jgi:diguanylate cyclase (GGDEF)-like protein
MTLRGARNELTALDSSSSRLRLLLIEDSSAHHEQMLAMLRDGFPSAEVQVEPDLDAALVSLAHRHVDVVLADLALEEVLRARVAARTAPAGTALMAVTGGVDGPLAVWMMADGAPDQPVEGEKGRVGLANALLQALQRAGVGEEAGRYLQLARGLLDSSEKSACAVDSEGNVVAVNPAWRDFALVNGGVDELCGVGVNYLDTCDRAAGDPGGSGAAAGAVVAQGLRDVLAGSVGRFSHSYPCHSPSENRWFTVTMTPAVVDGSNGAVMLHHDITAMHEMQRSAAHQSLHDPLTDLPNLLLMLDRIEQAGSDADRRGVGVAVTRLDLHRYDQVNDRLGYRGGDALLVQVAERLQAQLRPGDTLSRSSGDGFLVLWRDLVVDRPSQAVELSEGLVRALERPFDVAQVPVRVSASAGVAQHTAGDSVDALLQSTEAALQVAKGQGPGHVVLFTDEQREATTFRRSLETDLEAALEGAVTQFVLHYQPLVDLTSGQVVGVESLVRWQHPVWGLLGPDRFIPLAETTGLIEQLGDWVLGQAIHDTASLTHQGRELDVAVNVSVLQLDDQAVDKVRRALESSGVRPGRLILEVTESALVRDEETTAESLDAVSRLGVKIAIDDFGTGYSSLLYLRRYPVNTLKIDRAFVAGIGQNADDEAICRSIISLATAVGASTVGEGVETMEQYGFLRSLGCHHGQGFLWSPAVPLEKLSAAVEACDQVAAPAQRSAMARPRTAQDTRVTALISKMNAEDAPLHTIASALNRTIGSRPSGARWTAGSVARELPAMGEPPGSPGLDSSPRVLICNDVEPTRRLLRADLELAGFEVEEASDGRAAMARLIEPDARPFTTIVLDCQVPPFNGRWAISAIRGHRRLDEVPVLLVTDAASDRASYPVNAGLDVILTGPMRADKIVEAVVRVAMRAGGPAARHTPGG